MGVIVLKNRSFLLISILTVGLFLLIGGKDYSSVVAKEQENDTLIYEQLDLFGKVFERIRDEYIEEVSTKDLVEAAINGMLTSLDPHSSYLAPDDFKDMRTQTKGEFGGLGIEVSMESGVVKVITPIDNTSATSLSK